MMTVAVLRPSQAGPAFQSELRWSHDRTFCGHVVDLASPERKFAVELLVDGFVVGCSLANQPAAGLAVGDGCYGFSFALGAELLDEATVAEARLANLGLAVGEPVLLRQGMAGRATAAPVGAVRWLGGLRFTGWVAEDDGPVEISVDGEHVAEVQASGWAHIGDAADARAVRAFDCHLPERFADGAAHRLHARDARGRPLADSPQPFLAFAGGLARGGEHAVADAVRDDLRSEMFDRLVPMSVPFADYRRWRSGLPPRDTPASHRVIAVIATGAGDVDATVASLDAQSHGDWVAAALGGATDPVSFDPAALRDFLAGDGAEADLVLALPAGMLLAPDALARVAAAFDARPDAVAVYGDLELTGEDGSLWPMALPAFDYERLLEQGYCCQLFALRRDAAERAAMGGAGSLFRLFNALLDDGDEVAGRIVHLPSALASLPAAQTAGSGRSLAAATAEHLRRRGVQATVTTEEGRALPAVRVRRAAAKGRVSVIIPTRNRVDLVKACLESIRPAVSRAGGEILVVDNDSSDPATLAYLDQIDGRSARIIRAPGPFNFARLNNLAAGEANGDYLCLVNNDIEALDEAWLDEMLSRIAGPDVGAVGATLLWPSGVVQHAGVVLGPNFAAAHVGNDRLGGDGGYGDMLRVARQCGAVTAACLLTRRSDYLAVGGLDEDRFPVNFNDVDYCLKLRAIGRRVVVTPHARLLHRESASRGTDKLPDRKARLERELRNLRTKWGDALVSDPFYSPMLSLDAVPFSALAWPLRPLDQRTAEPPVAVTVPAGL